MLAIFKFWGKNTRCFSFCYYPEGSPQGITGNPVLNILSFLTLNNYKVFLFGLPLDLLSGTNIFAVPSLNMSKPSQSDHSDFISIHLTCSVHLMYTFLILFILITPKENPNIFITATSISASCLLLGVSVSKQWVGNPVFGVQIQASFVSYQAENPFTKGNGTAGPPLSTCCKPYSISSATTIFYSLIIADASITLLTWH